MSTKADEVSEQKIVDKCPSCGSTGTLFIGKGGYLTCSLIGCPQPGVGQAITQLRDELARLEASINLRERLLNSLTNELAHLRRSNDRAGIIIGQSLTFLKGWEVHKYAAGWLEESEEK